MKSWSADIQAKIEELSAILKPRGLDEWPRYVYHSTDVHNAAKILELGFLYSRIEALNRGLMRIDNASSEIIDRTPMKNLQFVRLYFRPRTPTQFNNEGIRPINKRSLNAHSPLPIFLCFDAQQVLSLDETVFSPGNMAKRGTRCSGERSFYLQIPFPYVFHEGLISSELKSTVTFHRNAEVLVPKCLPIKDTLKNIVCRSPAEMQTLLTLLSTKAEIKWKSCIRLDTKNRFFFREWTFVVSVIASPGKLNFQFNPSTTTAGPFNARVTYIEEGKAPKRWQGKIKEAKENLELDIPDAKEGIVMLELDDALAYQGRVNFTTTVV